MHNVVHTVVHTVVHNLCITLAFFSLTKTLTWDSGANLSLGALQPTVRVQRLPLAENVWRSRCSLTRC